MEETHAAAEKFCPQHRPNRVPIPIDVQPNPRRARIEGRALDWFGALGYRVVEDKATDYAHLKQALTQQFPAVRNRSELETRFFASFQKHNQKPSGFVYDLLKIHKILKLEMTEEKLIDHVISSEIQTKARAFVSLTGIGWKIGGRRDVTTDTRTIADRGGSSIDLRVKVLRIIGDSMVDAEVVNLIMDSIIKVVQGTVLSGEGSIRPIQSPYASPVVLTRKNNGLPPYSPEAYRFAIDYRKLNAITKNRDIHYRPKVIEKTAFITRNGTFAFLRMPFGLSGAAPNFQKAIDIILKPVIGRFVMVYMDDVIITSPSFNEHIDHLNKVFTLLRDAGLTLTLRALTLNSIEQLIREQREDPEVLEVRNINLIIWKKGKGSQLISTKCDCTIQDSPTRLVRIVMLRRYMLYRGQVMGQVDHTQENPKDLGKPRKRPTPEPSQGIKRTIPSSISRNYKYRRPNNPSQGPQNIAGPSHQVDTRQYKPHTEERRQGARGQYDRARETRTTPSKGNRAAERRPVRSRQATAVRPCPYYLWSRLKKPEGTPEEQRSNGIGSLPQNNLKRRSFIIVVWKP
ncbi:retrovirus-related Pol polyprotein from transposon 17.6 [Trichonephila clavipes]|nr:retrovirus-related Pol polyprotein from transposon 17.6 [Trichonephila clavipes]